MATELVPRNIGALAAEFLDSFRVVIINGPRQSGKTTLLQQLSQQRAGTYLTLDDGALRSAARADPSTFISDGNLPLMIDEIQRGGDDLVLAIKMAVDQNPARGQIRVGGIYPILVDAVAGRVVGWACRYPGNLAVC